ncbi:uncharacterized protein BX663DRAFT_565327 [Cokeromyces recurvatus]|uniref:uncharacterized protein n=1 Tax=Cokeromyces recurvatus TaxID=90255 RepID=UPI00221FAB3A|nr:uncharacterized protein BX663DRAFT_565327 [Cokeromyces recurvatus]KAI7897662.1 hypothetical protein BX663DRAFT_565327 [Cokeromyces recurvatus]
MTDITDVYSTDIALIVNKLQLQLNEINKAQNELVESISMLNANSALQEEFNDIKANMDQVATYNTKLRSLKAAMSMLSGRSQQLKERANKLKSIKLKYLSETDQIRKIEQEKDQTIAAKPSSTSLSTMDSIPKVKSIKKKKKTKAREVIID